MCLFSCSIKGVQITVTTTWSKDKLQRGSDSNMVDGYIFNVLGPVFFILYTQPLFYIVKTHTVNRHAFADDNQLYKVCTPDEIHQSMETPQNCITDIKTWMITNKLQLNDTKTEAMIALSN